MAKIYRINHEQPATDAEMNALIRILAMFALAALIFGNLFPRLLS